MELEWVGWFKDTNSAMEFLQLNYLWEFDLKREEREHNTPLKQVIRMICQATLSTFSD